MSKPILVIRMPFATPPDFATKFYENVGIICDDYNVLALRGSNQEVQFEVHSVLKVDPIEFEELKDKLLNEFKNK